MDAATPAPVTHAAEAAEARRLKWEAKQLDASRSLGAWELYRALNDAIDEGNDQFELSNRDARLALILMGGLNAALVILASQTNRGAELSPLELQIEYAVIAVYALFAIVFLLQAIDALRPKHFRPKFDHWPQDRPDFPSGIRYYEDVVSRDAEANWQAWRHVSVQQLNAELAVQFHSLCLKNQARKLALRRLFHSLRVMTMVFSAILLLFVIFSFI
ncbi:MAG TPA: hypothetical protein VF491_26265 [Vicinamibacterales bacterium]